MSDWVSQIQYLKNQQIHFFFPSPQLSNTFTFQSLMIRPPLVVCDPTLVFVLCGEHWIEHFAETF